MFCSTEATEATGRRGVYSSERRPTLHSTALNALHCSLVFDALDTLVVDSRGGKFSDFQGGVNVAAWAAGGLLPKSMHGTEVNGYIHICDCTFDYTLNCLCPGS